MRIWLLNRSNATTLTTQIRDVEMKVLGRQKVVKVRADVLMKTIHQQITAPTTLLLVTGIGFIIGDLTKSQEVKLDNSADKGEAVGKSPLKVAINLVTSLQTVYTALPIFLTIMTFFKPDASRRSSKQKLQTTTSDSVETGNNKSHKGNN